jgi:ATP-dependent Clp protease ATP-binding subunit ClpA
MISQNLEQILNKAIKKANEKKHEFLTLENVLFAMLEDEDVVEVLIDCGANMGDLKKDLSGFLEEDSNFSILTQEEIENLKANNALSHLILMAQADLVEIESIRATEKEAYDLTKTYVIIMAAGLSLTWMGVDLYWSIAIRTYKDTKKGKKGEEVAKRLSKTIDPNSFLLDNVKETRYNSNIED